MGLFCKSLAISFKGKSIFRFDYLAGTVIAVCKMFVAVSMREIQWNL